MSSLFGVSDDAEAEMGECVMTDEKVPPPLTRRFAIALLSDGDIDEQEIGEALTALGYNGVAVISEENVKGHEHPCPSDGCVQRHHQAGHSIPPGVWCCICWVRGEQR